MRRADPASSPRQQSSSDGLVILVGRDAEGNDALTLSAEPDDFWLHVAGTEGSHVVVRNPDHLPRLPRATLREAARLAAYYSKARGSRGAAVHYTQARHVRKGRRMPKGLVELSQWEIVRVPAELPELPPEEPPKAAPRAAQ